MWDESVGNFLFGSDHIQLSRHLPAPHPGSKISLGKPIRALVVCANPRLDKSPLEELEAERNLIIQALGKVGSVTLLKPPTLAEMDRILAKQQFDIIHFFGHGEFRADQGYLIFENEEGYTDAIDGPSLANIIKGKESAIQLVVLNTCESGRASRLTGSKFLGHYASGVAQALVKAGIPAVIAMQFRIPDVSARVFTERFYATLSAQLAKNSVDVEDCVAKARVAVQANAGRDFVDWAAPVVFLRSTLEDPATPKDMYTTSDGRHKFTTNEAGVEFLLGEDFVQVTYHQKTVIYHSDEPTVVELTQGGLVRIYPPSSSANTEIK
jgi:hypothetical protein